MNFASFAFWQNFIFCLAAVFLIKLVVRNQPWAGRIDPWLLVAMSLTLFGLESPLSLGILIFVGLVTWTLLHLMARSQKRLTRGLILGLGLTVLFSPLIFFKYRHLFFEDIFDSATADLTATSAIIQGLIPLGISFYTFQLSGLVIDTAQRRLRPTSLLSVANFASFFPQVVAGPIEKQNDLMPQLQRFQFRWNTENIRAGMKWVIAGLFYKLFLADNLAEASLWIHHSFSNAWLVHLANLSFGLRIYFDFCGYSFIAVGLAQLFGVTLKFNFDAPYIRRNIQEFWRTWHQTLMVWFRDYLYIPLGGNRVAYTGLIVLFVFSVSGLWHGAGWNFVLWGLYHGILVAAFRCVKPFSEKYLPVFISWAITFALAMTSWLFFYETDMPRLWEKIQTVFNLSAYNPNVISDLRVMVDALSDVAYFFGAMGVGLAGVSVEFISKLWKKEAYAIYENLGIQILLIFAIVLGSPLSDNGFIYFSF